MAKTPVAHQDICRPPLAQLPAIFLFLPKMHWSGASWDGIMFSCIWTPEWSVESLRVFSCLLQIPSGCQSQTGLDASMWPPAWVSTPPCLLAPGLNGLLAEKMGLKNFSLWHKRLTWTAQTWHFCLSSQNKPCAHADWKTPGNSAPFESRDGVCLCQGHMCLWNVSCFPSSTLSPHTLVMHLVGLWALHVFVFSCVWLNVYVGLERLSTYSLHYDRVCTFVWQQPIKVQIWT